MQVHNVDCGVNILPLWKTKALPKCDRGVNEDEFLNKNIIHIR